MATNKTKVSTETPASSSAEQEVKEQSIQTTDEDTETAMTKQVQDHTTVVIPYCKEFAQGKELLFALRSWQKNVRFPINIVVIGDREDWFDEENITYIKHTRVSNNPQIDTLAKLQFAIESPEVTDNFIWTNDDIYIVNPLSLAHVEIPKVLGELSPEEYSDTYKKNMENTIQVLKALGLPILNYGTHTPILFNKAYLADMLDNFPMVQEGGYLFSSVYFNSRPFPALPVYLDWRTDQLLLPIISKTPDEKKAMELLAHKVFLNNAVSGYSTWLEGFLESMFPEPSSFEV